jgi:hypothetical protein
MNLKSDLISSLTLTWAAFVTRPVDIAITESSQVNTRIVAGYRRINKKKNTGISKSQSSLGDKIKKCDRISCEIF